MKKGCIRDRYNRLMNSHVIGFVHDKDIIFTHWTTVSIILVIDIQFITIYNCYSLTNRLTLSLLTVPSPNFITFRNY